MMPLSANWLAHRHRWILFTSGAVAMILELIASRLLAPHFGSGNFVWTAIIGIILLASSLGNYWGGRLADRAPEQLLAKVLLSATALIFLIPLSQNLVLTTVSTLCSSVRIGAIVATLILFLPAGVALGMVSPIIAQLELRAGETLGGTSGQLYALGTLGSLLGTFGGGFYLIPHFGGDQILYFLSLLTLGLALLALEHWPRRAWWIAGGWVVLIVGAMGGTYWRQVTARQALLAGQPATVTLDTPYARVQVYNSQRGGASGPAIRVFSQAGAYSSATYTDPGWHYQLVFPYTQAYDVMYQLTDRVEQVLMIGGAGFSYPKSFLQTNPTGHMDVLEIDPQTVAIAREYFYLAEAEAEFDPTGERLHIITEDGRVYLNRHPRRYDVILNDSFTGETPPATLSTLEAVGLIRDSLTSEGVYLSNIIGALTGPQAGFLRSELQTVRAVFPQVALLPVQPGLAPDTVSNYLLIAANKPIDLPGTVEVELTDEDMVLTDNFAPVETLSDWRS